MAISLYEASVPVFQQMLGSLTACLQRAGADADRLGLDLATLGGLRLRADMMPLAQQVQVATNHAGGAPARLAGLPLPELGDDERTLEQMLDRITRTLDFLATLTPRQLDGGAEREITLPKRTHVRHLELAGLPQVAQDQYPMRFRGRDYLLRFALPNFYFHVTTAYVILRREGVNLGKHDYLGELPRLDQPGQ